MESLFDAAECDVIAAALLHYGAFLGTQAPTDVTAHTSGWECVDVLRKIKPYAADVLAEKLVPRERES